MSQSNLSYLLPFICVPWQQPVINVSNNIYFSLTVIRPSRETYHLFCQHEPSDCVIPEYLALKVQVDLLSTSTRSQVHVKDSETPVWHNLSVG